MSIDDKIYRIEDTNGDGKFNEGDDLNSDLKQTLGDYLSELTKGDPNVWSKNYYQVEGGSNDQVLSDPITGLPATPPPTGQGVEKQFMTYGEGTADETVTNSDAAAYFENISGGGSSDSRGGGMFNRESLDTLINKNDQFSGHELLANIKGAIKTSDDQPIASEVSKVLLHNRFSPSDESPFVNEGVTDSRFLFQHELGKYLSEGETDMITMEDLKKVAEQTMLRAGGEFFDDHTAASLVPGINQLGVIRSVNSRRATFDDVREVVGIPNKKHNIDIPHPEGDFGETESFTWGSFYTVSEQFSGKGTLGRVIMAPVMIAAVSVATAVMFIFIGMMVRHTTIPGSRGPFGSFRQERQSIIPGLSPEQIGLPVTEFDFTDCVAAGAKIFFGDNFKGSGQKGSLSFYIVLARSILRGVAIMIEKFASLDFGSVMSVLESILEIVEIIKYNRVTGYLGVLATLGDNAIRISIRTGALSDGDPASTTMSFPTPVSRVQRAVSGDRLTGRGRSGPLAWNQNTPSMYLLPLPLLSAKTAFETAGDIGDIMAGASHPSNFQVSDEGATRLTKSHVAYFEAMLDAEYVPFYFHDLRTNEIISFHAFLSSLDDSFTVNYDSTTAYGRGEPVLVYNNTARTISLTFTVVSTRKEDFDMMWWKINKLTTMLYPQWSAGTLISGEQGTAYRQPFSQIPTASPMIRLRLGDLFKTNYSRFSLARLFGLGEEKFNVSETESVNIFDDEDLLSKLQDLTDRFITNPAVTADPKDGPQPGDVCLVRNKIGMQDYENLLKSPALEDDLWSTTYGESDIYCMNILDENCKIKIIGLFSVLPPATLGPRLINTEGNLFIDNDALSDIFYVAEILEPGHSLVLDEFSEAGGLTDGVGKKIRIKFEDIGMIHQFMQLKASGELSPLSDALSQLNEFDAIRDVQSTARDFFAGAESDDSNPIVRSFESAGGKGLAGFITSINFNWLEHTWEIDQGSTAPKGCQVTLNFQPVHDITPGIDAYGANRAPIYNVGRSVGGLTEPHDRHFPNVDSEAVTQFTRTSFTNLEQEEADAFLDEANALLNTGDEG